jgi:membrane protein implicated in regulation of membrane protease activity
MSFILHYEIWLIVALFLISADIILGLDFILVAFGISAVITSASLIVKNYISLPFTDTWGSLITFFAIFSLIILIPLRRILQKSKNDEVDINNY